MQSTALSENGEQPGNDGDVPFWDWAPSEDSEDMRFSLDDDPSAGAGRMAAGGMVSGEAASGGAAAERAVVTPAEAAESVPQREGIGHSFRRLDHIFGNTRMGAWRRRAVLAIVVGVVVTILLDWRIGLTLAVVVAIADTIFQSRIAGPPREGVRLTKVQRHTQRQLARMERAGYRSLHSRLIPDSDEHIDHLMIGPAGVFAIDSEDWDKKLPLRMKNARQLWHGPQSKKDRLEHARWEAEQASEYVTRHADPQLLASLPGGKVTVRPTMAVYGPKIPWGGIATLRDVDVFSGPRLRTYVRWYAKRNTSRPLTPVQIEQIYKAAHGAFPNHDPGVPASSPFTS